MHLIEKGKYPETIDSMLLNDTQQAIDHFWESYPIDYAYERELRLAYCQASMLASTLERLYEMGHTNQFCNVCDDFSRRVVEGAEGLILGELDRIDKQEDDDNGDP